VGWRCSAMNNTNAVIQRKARPSNIEVQARMKHNRVHSSKFIRFRVLRDIPFLDWTFPSMMGCPLSGQIVPPKLMSTEQPLLVPYPDPQCTEGLGMRLSYCMLQTLKMLMSYTYTTLPNFLATISMTQI